MVNGIAVDGIDERVKLDPVYRGTVDVPCLLGCWR